MSGVLVTYLQEMEARKNPYKKAARSGGKNRGNLGRNQAPKLHDLPTVPKKIIKGKYKIKLSRRKGRVTTGVDSKQPIFLPNTNSNPHVYIKHTIAFRNTWRHNHSKHLTVISQVINS